MSKIVNHWAQKEHFVSLRMLNSPLVNAPYADVISSGSGRARLTLTLLAIVVPGFGTNVRAINVQGTQHRFTTTRSIQQHRVRARVCTKVYVCIIVIS